METPPRAVLIYRYNMPGFNIGPRQDQSAPDPNKETSRRHRFLLTVLNPVSRDLLVFAHKCGRPTPEIDRIVVHRGQDEIYMPGKNRWLPIELSFYEAHGLAHHDNTASELYDWWSGAVLSIHQSKINTGFKRDGRLQLLDGSARPVWEYKLLGTWPSKISPDTLDYSDNSICEISVTLQMDKCQEESFGYQIINSVRSSCDEPQAQETFAAPADLNSNRLRPGRR